MPEATYPLADIRKLISGRQYIISGVALDGAFELGFDDHDICDCIFDVLNETHFYKTMAAEKRVGIMQDVYRITYRGRRIYLKLQISADGQAVVVQFKEE